MGIRVFDWDFNGNIDVKVTADAEGYFVAVAALEAPVGSERAYAASSVSKSKLRAVGFALQELVDLMMRSAAEKGRK